MHRVHSDAEKVNVNTYMHAHTGLHHYLHPLLLPANIFRELLLFAGHLIWKSHGGPRGG